MNTMFGLAEMAPMDDEDGAQLPIQYRHLYAASLIGQIKKWLSRIYEVASVRVREVEACVVLVRKCVPDG